MLELWDFTRDDTIHPMAKAPPQRLPDSPGVYIEKKLSKRKWSQRYLSKIMGRPPLTVTKIVSGRKRITEETAKELAKALGTSPKYWIKLQKAYEEPPEEA